MQVKSLRELDKLVAEKIFGWCDFWENTSSTGYHYLMGYPPHELATGIDAERQEVLNYSTDIAAAWSIIEKFSSAIIEKSFLLGEHFSAYMMTSLDGYPLDAFIRAKTPEAAICICALKAKGVEVELDIVGYKLYGQ